MCDKKKKIMLLAAVLSGLMLFLFSCREKDKIKMLVLDPSEQQWLAQHKDELYFAPDPFFAPFEFYDEKDGITKGLANDYIRLIEKKLGVQFKIIHASSFNQILNLAKERKVAIVNAATKTPERSEYLLFTEPFVEVKTVILVRKEERRNLSLNDLNGKKVSMVQGYSVTEYLLKKYQGIEYDIVLTDLNAILNLSYKMSDAAVLDLATASYLIEKEGISNLRVAGDVKFSYKLAIGSRKDWPELNSILSKGLAVITPEERKEIHDRWFSMENVNILHSWEFRAALSFIILLFTVLGFILLWNKQLKKQIMLRTANLKKALDDLKISEEEHRSILQTAMDGIWRADMQGRLLEVNEAYCRMSGYDEKELLEMSIFDLQSPDMIDYLKMQIQKVKTEGEGRFETVHRRKDGNSFFVEISIQYKSSEGGRFVVFLRDVTERKRAEEELRESETHFRTLADSGQALIWTSGVDKKCFYFNQPWLKFTGRTMEQEIGDGWLEGVHPDDLQRCIKIYVEAFDLREKFSMDYRIRHADGGYRWIQDDGSPRYNSRDEFLGYIGHCLDITGSKEAEENIKALLREKEILLREVHHRIKNNMNTIKGLLTLQLFAEEDTTAAASLRDAESRVQSMIMLYDRLYCTDNYRELPVKDYIQSLADEIVGSFPESGIVKIETEIEDFILNINTLTPLGIIINELLTNTMKYAFAGRESGLIRISASMTGGHVKVVILDDGVGLPETISFEKSTGFGLDLINLLVEQIGGSIRIERGEGTCFDIEFDV